MNFLPLQGCSFPELFRTFPPCHYKRWEKFPQPSFLQGIQNRPAFFPHGILLLLVKQKPAVPEISIASMFGNKSTGARIPGKPGLQKQQLLSFSKAVFQKGKAPLQHSFRALQFPAPQLTFFFKQLAYQLEAFLAVRHMSLADLKKILFQNPDLLPPGISPAPTKALPAISHPVLFFFLPETLSWNPHMFAPGKNASAASDSGGASQFLHPLFRKLLPADQVLPLQAGSG